MNFFNKHIRLRVYANLFHVVAMNGYAVQQGKNTVELCVVFQLRR